MARFDERSGNLYVTELGRVASHFYISHASIVTFNDMLTKHMDEAKVHTLEPDCDASWSISCTHLPGEAPLKATQASKLASPRTPAEQLHCLALCSSCCLFFTCQLTSSSHVAFEVRNSHASKQHTPTRFVFCIRTDAVDGRPFVGVRERGGARGGAAGAGPPHARCRALRRPRRPREPPRQSQHPPAGVRCTR